MNYLPTFFGGIIYDSSNFSYIDFEELNTNLIYKSTECQMISLNLTNKCNFNCFYCLNLNHKESTKLNLKKILSVIKKYNPKEIVITGGEPTLVSNLSSIVKQLYKFTNDITILTNGSNLTKLYKLPKETKLRISIDSLDLKYFKRLNSKSSINLILENIIKLKKEGYSVGINTVYTKYNEKDVFKLFKLLKKEGINDFFVAYVFPRGHAIKDYNLIKGNITNYVKLIKKLYTLKFNINLLIDFNLNIFVPRYGSCSYKNAPYMFYLNRAGKIFYCDQFNNDQNMKFLRKINLMTINKDCQCCNLRWFCNGGCRANALILSKSIYEKDVISCNLFKEWYKQNRSLHPIINKYNFIKELNYDFNYFKKYLLTHFEGDSKKLNTVLNYLPLKDVDVLFYSCWQDFLFDTEFYLFDILKSNIAFFLKEKEYSKLCYQILYFWLAEQFMYSCIGEIIGQYLSSNHKLFSTNKLNESDLYLNKLFFILDKKRSPLRSGIVNNKQLNCFLKDNVLIFKNGFIDGLIEYVERNSSQQGK